MSADHERRVLRELACFAVARLRGEIAPARLPASASEPALDRLQRFAMAELRRAAEEARTRTQEEEGSQ